MNIRRFFLILAPVVTFFATKRICDDLHGTDAHPAAPGPNHFVVRTPAGGYTSTHGGGHGHGNGHSEGQDDSDGAGDAEEALDRLADLSMDLSLIQAHSVPATKVADGVAEFETYIRNNCEFIPNFGERYRQGETISTAFVESTINQVVSRRFVKKQQMQWTLRGAHLLLQTRTKVLNNELEEVFRHWYPRFRAQSA